MKNKNLVGSYYVLSALRSASMGFIMGVYSNFLRSGGLDEFWVNMVNVVYFVLIVLCEIPTGLFADIFGRKSSFVISCILETVSCTVYGFSSSFTGYAIAEGIGAIGMTFASGAFNAWLVDGLKIEGREDEKLKIFARRTLLSRIAVIISAIIGGWIGDRGLNLPFFAASGLYLITGIVAVIIMKETTHKKRRTFSGAIREIHNAWCNSIAFAKSDINFRFILILGAAQMFACMAPNMEWQKVFSNLGLSNSLNGVIGALINLALIIGVIFSERLGKLISGEKKQLIFIMVSVGVNIILSVSFVSIGPIIVFFFLHEVGRGMSSPIMESYTQNCITSKERATLDSIGSMVGHFGGAMGLIVSGLLAKYAGIGPAWIVSGTVLVLATLWLAKNHKGKAC